MRKSVPRSNSSRIRRSTSGGGISSGRPRLRTPGARDNGDSTPIASRVMVGISGSRSHDGHADWSRRRPRLTRCVRAVSRAKEVRSAGRRGRDLEAERAPLPHAALHPHRAVVERHRVLHNREPEPGAALLARARLVDPVEALEHAREVGGGDAGPGVAHLAPRAPVALAHGHGDLAALGVLDRVVEEVREHLHQAHAIGEHRHRLGPLPHEREPGASGRVAHLHHLLGGERAKVERLASQHHVRPLELGEREEIVDECLEPHGLVAHHAHERLAVLGVVEPALEQRLGVAAQRGERRAELVRHVRHEILPHALQRLALGEVVEHEQHRARRGPAERRGRGARRAGARRPGLQLPLHGAAGGAGRPGQLGELILAHMSDGVALIDGADRVVHVNHRFAELLDAPLRPAPGTPFGAFTRVPELAELARAARTTGRTVERELKPWTTRTRPARATATSLGGPAPSPVLLVLHDLSESEALQRMRQDFVANVSHELRTPLTSLRGYAETLLEGGLDDAEHREAFVRVMRDQAVRLQALVDDLLSLAELERPDVMLRREPLDLRALAAEQMVQVRDAAARAGLALVLEGAEPVPVLADRVRLMQVLANLLDNAVKYTERGQVTVAVGQRDGRAWCEVRDTGPGIPAADLARVFERFYRVDKARSREKGGTGLGLAIVKHAVALHDGTVGVESRVGEGSTFRFEIPATPPC